MTDAELLGLLRNDPEKGLKHLTKQYGGLVYAVIRRRLGNGVFGVADIESCAADTISEFYLDLDKFDLSKGSVKAWLCVIASHNAADLRREAPLPLNEDINAAEVMLESNLEESEMRKAVLASVKSLKEPDREILLRKYYLGESSKEIAARLGMSVSNIDTRASRAVEELRRILDDWRK